METEEELLLALCWWHLIFSDNRTQVSFLCEWLHGLKEKTRKHVSMMHFTVFFQSIVMHFCEKFSIALTKTMTKCSGTLNSCGSYTVRFVLMRMYVCGHDFIAKESKVFPKDENEYNLMCTSLCGKSNFSFEVSTA